ncbi:MAG: 30S ribosomal protein S17 [bacterium]
MRGQRLTIVGTVVGNSMDKTVVVQVEMQKRHPVIKKYVRTRKKYHAHDEKNECGIGDRVRMIETRPLSKTKRWCVIDIVEHGKGRKIEIEEPEEIVMRKIKPPVAAEAEPESEAVEGTDEAQQAGETEEENTDDTGADEVEGSR